jgi:hypothetical protein
VRRKNMVKNTKTGKEFKKERLVPHKLVTERETRCNSLFPYMLLCRWRVLTIISPTSLEIVHKCRCLQITCLALTSVNLCSRIRKKLSILILTIKTIIFCMLIIFSLKIQQKMIM